MRAIVPFAVLVLVVLLLPGGTAAIAQTAMSQQVPTIGDETPPVEEATAGTDMIGMGVSLGRIRRELREVAPSKKESVLRLDFHVDVYGKAPKIDVLKGADVSANGAVRYGGMTHNEFLDLVTPRQFQPGNQANVGAAIEWLMEQLNKRTGGE